MIAPRRQRHREKDKGKTQTTLSTVMTTKEEAKLLHTSLAAVESFVWDPVGRKFCFEDRKEIFFP